MRNLSVGNVQPRYPHDACSTCTFLGRIAEFDLYHCSQHGNPTVIARYGENGEYQSGMDSRLLALVEAQKIAKANCLPCTHDEWVRQNMNEYEKLVADFEQAVREAEGSSETASQSRTDDLEAEATIARKALLIYIRLLNDRLANR